MKREASLLAFLASLGVLLAAAPAARSADCNLKVITDGNPDYSDMDSMVRSITANWPTTQEQCWAMFYWNHRARRQTAPMYRHGMEQTDPIRQFNDYGYTQCSTISGINCGIWDAMGLSIKLWDITNHSVPEVQYDGRYHCYDNSMSAIYTLCDGTTIAGVEDIGQDGACAASGGVVEAGHIAKYHCLMSTSPNGFLTGADCARDLAQEYACFNPAGLKYRYYYNNWDRGHRYTLNLRDDEIYTRYYHQMDRSRVLQTDGNGYSADPAFFIPNNGVDPETPNPRYHLRGNGIWLYTPALTGDVSRVLHDMQGIVAASSVGVQPAQAGQTGEAVFRISGANVICSMTLTAALTRASAADVNRILVSTCNGLTWQTVWTNAATGDTNAVIALTAPVNGAYEVLVKVQLRGAAAAANARLRRIAFETVTMVNAKTQPQLKLGRNTVYVGAGDPTDAIVFWPDLSGTNYKPYAVAETNIATDATPLGYVGTMYQAVGAKEASVTFRMDAPRDITRLVYGGRLCNRNYDSRIAFRHSFDNGATWITSYTLTNTLPPWDVLHTETVTNIPAGTRSVLYQYALNGTYAGNASCGLYAVRMEASCQPADSRFKPLDVSFTWREPQTPYGPFVERSHIQRVDRVPFAYTINTGGADHPVMQSLRVNLAGTVPGVTDGYSDGRDVGGTKFQERWETVGRVLSQGKPYTCSIPSETTWEAGDPTGKVLTDGVIGPTYPGGAACSYGALWSSGQPLITVDLGAVTNCGAFRLHTTGGWPWYDSMLGENTDQGEVLTSTNGTDYVSQGFFNFNLRWRDLPVNYFWNQDETIAGHNFELIIPNPVQARYVRFKLTPSRSVSVSEVQVLDFIRYQPFDLRLSLPTVNPTGTVLLIRGPQPR